VTATTTSTHDERAIGNVPRRLLIGGRWVDAAEGRTFATIDPATEDAIVEVAHGGAADVDAAVAAARAAFEDPNGWSSFTPR
jgi:phenylacetaldehyde dehydrogenase